MTEAKTYTQEEYDDGVKQAINVGRQQGQNELKNLAASIKMQRDEANDKIADLNVVIMELNQSVATMQAQLDAKAPHSSE